MQSTEQLKRILAVARGDAPAELLLAGGKVANVFTREVTAANVAVQDGTIAGIGTHYTGAVAQIDVSGLTLVPGLIDAHLHVESTLLLPAELARVAVRHGTTAVIADPHEIANVLGEAGVYFMLEASEGLPVDFFFTVPSCVPATTMETSGGEIGAAPVERLLEHPRMLGLAEMMNYPGAIHGDEAVLRKIAAARVRSKVVDGHAPGVNGAALQAYLACGISTDHESTTAAEALEKVRSGMKVIIRQGSAARNLSALLPALREAGPAAAGRFMIGSDDREVAELLSAGHIDTILRQAVALGCDPLTALQLATINPACHYRLPRRGALAPGYRADVVAVDNLKNFNVRLVIKNGRIVYRAGGAAGAGEEAPPPEAGFKAPRVPESVLGTVVLPRPLSPKDFTLRTASASGPVPVIGIIPGQIITEKLRLEPARAADGTLLADPARDLLKLAVVERHRGTGRIGLGLLRGLGLREGAIASSVAHDSHNLIIAGTGGEAMAAAANALARAGGGFAVVDGRGEVRALLPLPVAGLMSLEPAERVAAGVEAVTAAARALGAKPEQPFLTLSFMALPVIPRLKLTDRGLVDVDSFRLLDL